MDSDYLKSTVGNVLAQGIAETVLVRPEDPVDFLAKFLLRSEVDKEAAAERKNAIAAAEKARVAKADQDAIARAEARKTEKKEARLEAHYMLELQSVKSNDAMWTAAVDQIALLTGASAYLYLTYASTEGKPAEPAEEGGAPGPTPLVPTTLCCVKAKNAPKVRAHEIGEGVEGERGRPRPRPIAPCTGASVLTPPPASRRLAGS